MALPRNLAQTRYVNLLARTPVVIATGPAGTGKTLLACQSAARSLVHGHVDRIVLTRPAISVDEQHGYLPGDVAKKMEPWTRPMFDALGRYFTPKKVNDMMYDRRIEICPLAYMRGRTFDHAWILGDEMQNSTPSQMKMLLTRLGENSQMVLTGDLDQHDRGYENNGLMDLLLRLQPSESIQHIAFTEDDVIRNEVIKEILRFYA